MEVNNVAPKPKIVAMSGGGQRGLLDWKAAALELGADQVLLKPFDQRTVLLTLQEVLGCLPWPFPGKLHRWFGRPTVL
jgi:DNA-binding response OmpR family regulator